MKTLVKGVEIELEALGKVLPFAMAAGKSGRIVWAGPGILQRAPDFLETNLERVLRDEEGEIPGLDHLEEKLGVPGRWFLRAGEEELPLSGVWIRAGSGYLFLARPDPFSAEELSSFSFEDFPWDDLPILYLTSLDEFRNSLEELKAVAGLLKKREAYLQTLLDSVPLGVVLIDQETRTVAGANPYALRIIGAESGQVMGKPCTLFCSHLDAICPYLDEGKPLTREETIIRRLDGSTVPVLKSVKEVEAGGRKYLLDTFLDIRERKALERRVMQAQKMESVGQLAAGVAHEINTPIQFIGDNLRFLKDSMRDALEVIAKAEELLSRSGDEGALEEFRKCKEECDLDFFREEVPSALEQSLEGLKRMGKIVEALKSFTQPERDGMEPVDLNEAVEKALAVSQGEWRRVAGVELDLEPGLPRVPGRLAEIQQTLLVLLSNAAHAVEERWKEEGREGKGRIRILTRRLDEAVEIRIQDEGTGIPEELRDKVFDPFFSTKGVGIGSGKGLAYAHSVVVGSHGGEIFFETERGKGTTFVLRFPVGLVAEDPGGGA